MSWYHRRNSHIPTTRAHRAAGRSSPTGLAARLQLLALHMLPCNFTVPHNYLYNNSLRKCPAFLAMQGICVNYWLQAHYRERRVPVKCSRQSCLGELSVKLGQAVLKPQHFSCRKPNTSGQICSKVHQAV